MTNPASAESWVDREFDATSGLFTRQRHGESPPVVCLHGFTQTGRSWSQVADLLGDGVETYCPDAPGHGLSGRCRLDITHYADALASSLPPSIFVGYSMGGRTALHVAIRHPASTLGLLLVGATPGLSDSIERNARRESDDRLADRLESMDIDDFLEEWLGQPLFSTLSRDDWDLADRRRNDVHGLAHSLRTAGTGVQESLWDLLSEITCPVVLVTGERDKKFEAIAERMSHLLGGPIEHVRVPMRGHAVHIEDPHVVADLIGDLRRRVA